MGLVVNSTEMPILNNTPLDADLDVLDDDVDSGLPVLAPIELELTPEVCGVRLDKVLSTLVSQYSRSRLQQWIDAGHVSVDGEVARAKMTMYGDEKVIILPQPAPEDQAFKPEAMDLKIVHEDAAIMVIDKPAGLVVHPAAGNWSGTLMNGLLHLFSGDCRRAACRHRASS
jgi:23S rRNA pseudouridine1911/1915/1917 synthase